MNINLEASHYPENLLMKSESRHLVQGSSIISCEKTKEFAFCLGCKESSLCQRKHDDDEEDDDDGGGGDDNKSNYHLWRAAYGLAQSDKHACG